MKNTSISCLFARIRKSNKRKARFISILRIELSRVSENEFYARLTANFKVYHDSYLSHVTSKSYGKGDYTIVSKADSGMFKFLNSTWDIKNEGPNKCFVDYNLEFEFNNFLYQSVSGMVLDVVGAKTLEAFEQRVYDIRKIIGTCEQKAEAAESHPIGKTLLHPETAPKKVPLSARLLKPRRNVDLKVKKLDSKSVLHDLYKLAEANKIEKDKFNTILDSFEKDEFIKNSIKNLFSLWKQESISERQFLFYLNEFLTMHVH